jgi:hypothetical protein
MIKIIHLRIIKRPNLWKLLETINLLKFTKDLVGEMF